MRLPGRQYLAAAGPSGPSWKVFATTGGAAGLHIGATSVADHVGTSHDRGLPAPANFPRPDCIASPKVQVVRTQRLDQAIAEPSGRRHNKS